MKMNKISLVFVTILIVTLLSSGIFLVAYQMKQTEESKVTNNSLQEYETFSSYTSVKEFANIPVLFKKGCKVSDAYEYGKGYYTLSVSGTTKADYDEYLTTLAEKGFDKHSDNGVDGMSGYVYTASFTKEDLVVTVYHILKYEATYITASKKSNLSDHLIYQEAYLEGVQPDAKTTVHLVELNDNGNSYVIQLKNGNFIVEDGGNEADAPYLLDYLESLTPEGKKPVIEAWFISHAHADHIGAIRTIMNNATYANRIYVEGVYYVDPSNEVQQSVFPKDNQSSEIWFAMNANTAFKQENGSVTKFYRPTMGQRYYFCDISIDVVLTIDQILEDAYYTADFNDTSTWLMHNIEGQKFLHAGDAGVTTTKIAMDLYEKEYFELDVFSVLHHGINVYDYFTDYCDIKTLLYTNRSVGSLYTATVHAKVNENAYLQESALESLSHGNGTVVLSFPYSVGTAKTMEPCDWRYNNGERVYHIWDVVGGRKETE